MCLTLELKNTSTTCQAGLGLKKSASLIPVFEVLFSSVTLRCYKVLESRYMPMFLLLPTELCLWFLTTQIHLYNQVRGFPGGRVVKSQPADAGDAGDVGSVRGLERCPWKRKWQPPSVFLPGISHGQTLQPRGYSPWGGRFGQDWTRLSTHAHNQVKQMAQKWAVGCGYVDGGNIAREIRESRADLSRGSELLRTVVSSFCSPDGGSRKSQNLALG